MSKKPKAIELADFLVCAHLDVHAEELEAAALLRSQHALIGELVEALKRAQETTDSEFLSEDGTSLIAKAKAQQ